MLEGIRKISQMKWEKHEKPRQGKSRRKKSDNMGDSRFELGLLLQHKCTSAFSIIQFNTRRKQVKDYETNASQKWVLYFLPI
jgi:hypothetical protein